MRIGQGEAVVIGGSENEVKTEFKTVTDEIAYYLGKLKDKSFTSTYGSDDEKTWYTAAEALGRIGKRSIPHLAGKLDSRDPYELKLVLYALMLASQDAEVLRVTNNEYVRYSKPVLTEETNVQNKSIALLWWQKYKHLIDN